ncbi:MAG TPA: DNA-directed RNA polymerase subunit beta [Candidatus Avimonoglobus intestinipullorum]|uniref:DNA-directed RNA polymerase subunit beta n=1 Tax=Candidatus Avimonoglobus intestinipullorum TaxID=2840699 RepID=A0A9D1LUG3_9FIRM|nr:DNA-directed RNA polymerase subunit beta [Candidatus Avimonoglobus intestinipullorum]
MVHEVQLGKNTRLSYSKINEVLEMPNLIEVQKNSYKWFLDEGLREVFHDISPITDHSGHLVLEFFDYKLDYNSKYSVEECKERDAKYAAPLRVSVRLINTETGEIKEQEIFMGDFPLMTEQGTFIINGAERVIVSQLVRSPGIYYGFERDKTGKPLYNSTVIPYRGAWLEYETDSNDIFSVRIDRTRKLPVTILIRAMGVETNGQIEELFGEDPRFSATFEKDPTTNRDEALLEIYKRLRPGEPLNVENAESLIMNMFFDPKRYDLARVGRYKFDKKLGIAARIKGKTVADDVVSPITGEILAQAGDALSAEMAEAIERAGVNKLDLLVEERRVRVFSNDMVYLSEYMDMDLKEFHIQKVRRSVLEDILAKAENDEAAKKMVYDRIDELSPKHITIDDMMASINYVLNLANGVGALDDIDHLGNRRLRCVGELLQNQFRIGLARMERVVRERMTIQDMEIITPQTLINIRPIIATINEFFGSSQLSQFMDQPNPLAELRHKRRISALGPGGLSRERAGFEVRDVHYSHYGRMCPIETPEGPNIGLITSLATFARVNEYGFIEAPYRKVDKATGCVTDEIVYMTADMEDEYIIAQANEPLDENGRFMDKKVSARYRDEILEVPGSEIDYMDVSPRQLVSVVTACIPFLENDDANRALMGSNMQCQAVPLLTTDSPIIGTGMEYKVARDSGSAVLSKEAGVVEKVSADEIIIKGDGTGVKHRHKLIKFARSNQSTCINQRPIVKVGEHVEQGDIIADGPAMDNGELALGKNILIGFMTWEGYNYEDAVLISEELVKHDVFTSIHIEEYECEARDTKLGPEEITRDIPNVSEDALKDLDDQGVIRIGAEVRAGDILVGKVTPKGETELTAEERLLRAIFGEKAREVRDTSLRVPHGENGIIVDVKKFTRENGDELSPGVNQVVRCYIAQKRKISVGDKMAGRHGNKGVVSRVLPQEDMPFLEDGTPLQIVLNPLGVPSRMNIGQVLEMHLGYAYRKLGDQLGKAIKIATPVFDGAQDEDLKEAFEKAGLRPDFKSIVYDGRTGDQFDNPVTVGIMYYLKLDHLVDDKIHARSTGPYSLVTQQPLGGKAQFGGQRFGEMEVWALEAYGAAYTLQEILTVKSDDIVGRVKTYEAIVKGENIPKSGIPESFKVLVKELQSLALDIRILNHNMEEIDLDASLDDDDNDYVEKDDILSAMEDRDGVASQLEDLPDDMLLDDMDGEDDLEDLDEDLSFIDDEEEEAEAEDSNIITMDDF